MQPIYEQIVEQVKGMIMKGALEQEGFIVTVHGKGSFVAGVNQNLLSEEQKKEVERDLEAAIRKGRSCGMSSEDIRALFDLLMEE